MSHEHPPRLAPEITPAHSRERALELTSSGETEPLVLSRGNLFCVTNQRGDIAPAGARDLGLFHDDTRHLSYLELFVAGGPPLVLSSDTRGAAMAQIDLTLSDSQFGGFLDDPQNFLHLRRKRLLDDALVEQLILTNHLRRPIQLWLELRMAADFADVFEVRGARRKRRGTLKAPQYAGDQLVLAYHGLDGEDYRTVAVMRPTPMRCGPTGPFWQLELQPGEATVLEAVIQPMRGAMVDARLIPFDLRQQRIVDENAQFVAGSTRIRARHNPGFNEAMRHALEDIQSLRLRVEGQRVLAAGIPWFAAPFGRDAAISSWELLSVAPELAKHALRTLAAYQGTTTDPWREEEPGKILHELRRGEMARAGEVPHSPYYGSIDSTPLWLMLLGETWRWTGDRALVDELLPAACRALDWLEHKLDDGGGLLRYRRSHEKSLENQGWKDSRDGVSFPDGTLAVPPIALVEAQGYAVAALRAMAMLLGASGDPDRAASLDERARVLTARIDEQFWVPSSNFFALALDGANRPVPTITSNPGHLLFAGAVGRGRASRIVDVLLAEECWSGYGVRTLARGQAVYNPLSYHNGSVWPHDNALIAFGAARYGRSDAAVRILEGLYDASRHFRRHRLPELFCGLGRSDGDFLVHYPVSCSPQAWASGAPFLLLQAVLGLHADAPSRRLTIRNPRLPEFLDVLELDGLRVGDTRLALRFERHGRQSFVEVLETSGGALQVSIELD
jgi:glycogen debranching enzyme